MNTTVEGALLNARVTCPTPVAKHPECGPAPDGVTRGVIELDGTSRASAAALGDVEDTTRRVAELYARALKLAEVQPDDDFFRLGGTSLLAVELLDMIEEDFSLTLPARTFYRASTVQELALEVHAIAHEEQATC